MFQGEEMRRWSYENFDKAIDTTGDYFWDKMKNTKPTKDFPDITLLTAEHYDYLKTKFKKKHTRKVKR